MKKVLIVSGHPRLVQSFASQQILKQLSEHFPQAEIHALDANQQGFEFDIEREQQRLAEADIVVLQYPVFWYGVPALMKKWIEDVFLYGFAYGSTGNKLHGKQLLLSFTSGAPEAVYTRNGNEGFDMDEYLLPLKQTAALCGMSFAGFVFTGGYAYTNVEEAAGNQALVANVEKHVVALAERLKELDAE